MKRTGALVCLGMLLPTVATAEPDGATELVPAPPLQLRWRSPGTVDLDVGHVARLRVGRTADGGDARLRLVGAAARALSFGARVGSFPAPLAGHDPGRDANGWRAGFSLDLPGDGSGTHLGLQWFQARGGDGGVTEPDRWRQARRGVLLEFSRDL